jgi:hypothetical protein
MISCSASRELTEQDFKKSTVDPGTITDDIPDYRSKLQSLKGKGRAIVSEPGSTDRVTVLFSSNRKKSLVTVRNSIGVEGGQLLTDGDTLLVYNKVDKFARKIAIRGGQLDRINKLASLNILEMINYPVDENSVENVLESGDSYKLKLSDGSEIYVDKESRLIQQVVQPEHSKLPYSKITYEAYASLDGFKLPRRISIFGSEKKSKVALQLTSLELNPVLDSLYIDLPGDIPVYTR